MRAPAQPVSASASNVAAIVISILSEAGASTTASRGSAAPAVNDAEDAAAACNGRACDSSVIPSSSAGVHRQHIVTSAEFSRDLLRQVRREAAGPVDRGKLRALAGRVVEQFAPLEP